MLRRQSELFDRAAECERLMDSVSDPVKKAPLGQLRNLWIALANESPSFTSEVLAQEIAMIERIQSSFADETDHQARPSLTQNDPKHWRAAEARSGGKDD
jgi:hypothetical protein